MGSLALAAGILTATIVSGMGANGAVEQSPEGGSLSPVPENWGWAVGPGDQTAPDLSWPFLAWENRTTAYSRVNVMNLTVGVPGSPSGPGQNQRHPTLLGELLAYVSGYTQMGCSSGWCVNFADLRTGAGWRFSGYGSKAAPAGQFYVQVDGFHSPGFPSTYYVNYLPNGTYRTSRNNAEDPWEPPMTGPVATEAWTVLSLSPYGSLCNGFTTEACVNELSVLDMMTFAERRLTDSLAVVRSYGQPWEAEAYLSACGDFTWEGFPSVSGSIVYWQDNRNSQFELDYPACTWGIANWDLYAYDLTSGKEEPLRTTTWNETHPDADGNLLVWADDRTGNSDIYAASLDSGKEFRLTDDPADQRNPVVSQGCVAWEDKRSGDWDIYGTCLHAMPLENRVIRNLNLSVESGRGPTEPGIASSGAIQAPSGELAGTTEPTSRRVRLKSLDSLAR